MNDRHKRYQAYRLGVMLPAVLPWLIGALIAFCPAGALAHGGDDHGAAEAVPAASSGAGELTTHAVSGRFELLLKYPAADAGKPARLRFFLADYATNRAVTGANFVVSSRPRGIITHAPATMTAPGIYELVASFPKDTVYSLVATLAAGDISEQIELPNVYAGEAAHLFLAEHGGAPMDGDEGSGGSWLVPVVILGAAVLGIIAFLGVRPRAGKPGIPPAAAPGRTGPDRTSEPVSIPAKREEENR